MPFLPQNYEPPASGNYMKLQIGDNRIRILGEAIVGNEFWQQDGDKRRPVRRRMGEEIHHDELGVDKYGKRERVQHFWAFPVWNYSGGKVQILEVTQRTIQDSIRSLAESEDWGDPIGYDLTIKKSGSGLDTEYGIIPKPPTPIPDDVQKAYDTISLNLDALFDGEDPFTGGNGQQQPPAKQHEPSKLPDAGTTLASIIEVKHRKAGNVEWWTAITSQGEFITTDANVAATAKANVNGEPVALVYSTNKKGFKQLDNVLENQHKPVVTDDDDIPF